MQKYLHDQFLNEDHDGLLNQIKITLIDKTDTLDTGIRGEYQKTKLSTVLALPPLNIEE